MQLFPKLCVNVQTKWLNAGLISLVLVIKAEAEPSSTSAREPAYLRDVLVLEFRGAFILVYLLTGPVTRGYH